jgi:hypothetical protein
VSHISAEWDDRIVPEPRPRSSSSVACRVITGPTQVAASMGRRLVVADGVVVGLVRVATAEQGNAACGIGSGGGMIPVSNRPGRGGPGR